MDFQKRMTGFFMHSVCLPENVREHFNGFVGKLLEFKSLSGDTWHVGLIGSGDKLVLQPGWNNFASSNNVSQNDLLCFKFLSGSTFEVRIFDPTGHEKSGIIEREGGEEEEEEASDNGKATEVKIQESSMSHSSSTIETAGTLNSTNTGESIPYTENISPRQNESSLPLKKRPKMSVRSPFCLEQERALWKEILTLLKEESLQNEGENEISPVKKKINRSEDGTSNQTLHRRKRKRPENCQSETETIFADNRSSKNLSCDAPTHFAYGPRIWQAMSEKQKRMANWLANEIQTGNPAFLYVLPPACRARPHVAIPKIFSAKELPKRNKTFVLRRPERENTWHVKYYFRKKCQSIEGNSLSKFVQENNLQEGDVCIFELVKTENQITFLVHVSRAS